mmetsp:Transcript_16746/g.38665  ORF Transcript_16746/g.38665 Transcript_16746/m.38665 type:complete len:168 (+) Transcript_16746:416-919(+)
MQAVGAAISSFLETFCRERENRRRQNALLLRNQTESLIYNCFFRQPNIEFQRFKRVKSDIECEAFVDSISRKSNARMNLKFILEEVDLRFTLEEVYTYFVVILSSIFGVVYFSNHPRCTDSTYWLLVLMAKADGIVDFILDCPGKPGHPIVYRLRSRLSFPPSGHTW